MNFSPFSNRSDYADIPRRFTWFFRGKTRPARHNPDVGIMGQLMKRGRREFRWAGKRMFRRELDVIGRR
jgi:hypothetical protein